VDYFSAQFLLTVLIQPFKASCLLVAWEEMFRMNSFEVVDKVFLHIVDKCKDMIHNGKNVPGIMEVLPRRINYEDLKRNFDSNRQYFKKFERLIYLEQFHT
jgi:hypothetical protein